MSFTFPFAVDMYDLFVFFGRYFNLMLINDEYNRQISFSEATHGSDQWQYLPTNPVAFQQELTLWLFNQILISHHPYGWHGPHTLILQVNAFKLIKGEPDRPRGYRPGGAPWRLHAASPKRRSPGLTGIPGQGI